ncbi:flagellar type III secretion system pore protein FliP [Melioribacteraceae bacterium 4301-Me]|uniref:flagellar type III secretion system pore protein FliP n=1 Tax=Pyranulibacter aquaticus TaxID=3163344 RepID=UPI00359A057A
MKNFLLTGIILISIFTVSVKAQANPTIPLPSIGINIKSSDKPEDVSVTLQILFLMTILSVAPSLLIMTTSYLRTIIVFHFLKNALGTQQMPPSQLLAGIALFITFFVMAPTWNKVYDDAVKPLMDGKIKMQEAYDKGIEPIRNFMFKSAREEDIELFASLANLKRPKNRSELPTYILIPAFILSELRIGFIMGFFLFIPFVMVDMIVSSILLSMGMMMIPPMMVSLPFKILLFILVDGWNLVVGSLIRSFG